MRELITGPCIRCFRTIEHQEDPKTAMCRLCRSPKNDASTEYASRESFEGTYRIPLGVLWDSQQSKYVRSAFVPEASLERYEELWDCWNLSRRTQEPKSYEGDIFSVALLLESERDQLKAENEALRKALLEASDEVASWGAYASEYFQEKHDLAGCVARLHDAAMSKEAQS